MAIAHGWNWSSFSELIQKIDAYKDELGQLLIVVKKRE